MVGGWGDEYHAIRLTERTQEICLRKQAIGARRRMFA